MGAGPQEGAGPSDASVYASRSTAESRCACACASYRAAPAEKRRRTSGSTIADHRPKSVARKAACAAPRSGWNVAFPPSPAKPSASANGATTSFSPWTIATGHVGSVRRRAARPQERKPFAERAPVHLRRYAACSPRETCGTQGSATGRNIARKTRETPARVGESDRRIAATSLRDTPAGSDEDDAPHPVRVFRANSAARNPRGTTRRSSRTARGAAEERREREANPSGRSGPVVTAGTPGNTPSKIRRPSPTRQQDQRRIPSPTTMNSHAAPRASTTAASCRSVCAAVREKRRRADPRGPWAGAPEARGTPGPREFWRGRRRWRSPPRRRERSGSPADGPPLPAKRAPERAGPPQKLLPRVSPDRQSRRAARSAAITGGGSAVE